VKYDSLVIFSTRTTGTLRLNPKLIKDNTITDFSKLWSRSFIL